MQLGQIARFGGRSWVRSALNHGATATITGSGFGTKATAAPVKWVTCESGVPSDDWSTRYPTTAGAPYDMAYSTAINGVNPPHSRSSKYARGCHKNYNDANAGNFVGIATNYTQSSYPAYSYWGFYWRVDPNWVDDGDDGNFKFYSVNNDATAGHFGLYWYYEITAGWPLRTSSSIVKVDAHDSGNLGGSGWTAIQYGGQSNNPINGWIYTELLIKWDRTAGQFAAYENGANMIDFVEPTDADTGTSSRAEMIGNYARARHVNNFRYIDDIYFDRTWQRLMLGNASTLAASTLLAPQICQSWGNTSITFTVNLGGFPSSTNAYLFVVDATNTVVATFPVTLGT